MISSSAIKLKSKIPNIMKAWEERAKKEIIAARNLERLALRDTLPEYLMGLADALNNTIESSATRIQADRKQGDRIGKLHGSIRAQDVNFTIDQLIFEYHILRQVIFDIMDEQVILTPAEREVILCSIEQAVNVAATHFSNYKQEANRLAATIKARDEFLSIASHELRSPITSIKLQLEMILRNIVLNKPVPQDVYGLKKVFDNLLKQVDRLTKLVEDLLDVSSVHLGKLKIKIKKEVDIGSLVQEIVECYRQDESALKDPSINISFTPPAPAILGEVDSSRIVQVMRNLLSNALKYGGKIITVSVKKTSVKEIEISVEDNGRGIENKDKERIFHMFERAGSNVNESGLGLGLYITNQIIIAHGGSLKMESESGKGTKFIIKLPI